MTDILNAAPAELEQAAHVLEQSGDYRVLRRLVPRDDFGTRPDGPLLKAVVVDVETTGTDTEHDHIIELGMVCFEYSPDTGEVAWVSDVYDSFEDPGVPIPPESTAIHGITREMVAGHRLDDDAVAELLEDAQWVVAHNAAFDRPLLERRLPVFAGKRWLCPGPSWGFPAASSSFWPMRAGSFMKGTAARSTAAHCSRFCVCRCRRPQTTPGSVCWPLAYNSPIASGLSMRPLTAKRH